MRMFGDRTRGSDRGRATPSWILAGWLLLTLPVLAQENVCDVAIGSCHRAPLSAEGGGIIDKVVVEAFQRIGKRACIVALPCERSLMSANNGEIDGDILRIPAAIKHDYPHLQAVQELLYPMPMNAFALRKDVRVEKFDDLAALRVGYIIGWKILEDRVRAADVLRVRGPNELFGLLADGRADVVIYERLTGLKTAAELGLRNIHPIDPPLVQTQQYLVLHERHAKLLEPLAAAIRSMKSDGSYSRAFRAADMEAPSGR